MTHVSTTLRHPVEKLLEAEHFLARMIVSDGLEWLCCTNPVRDSSRESSVVAVAHEQTHTRDLQDQELALL